MMRWVAIVALAGCAKTDEYKSLKSETLNNGTYWCPTLTSTNTGDLFCTPVSYKAPPDVKGQELREWIADAQKFAAAPCVKGARASGAGCIMTRLVVCSTHDVGEANVCFLTWVQCEANIAAHPDAHRHCTVYFDGEPLRE